MENAIDRNPSKIAAAPYAAKSLIVGRGRSVEARVIGQADAESRLDRAATIVVHPHGIRIGVLWQLSLVIGSTPIPKKRTDAFDKLGF